MATHNNDQIEEKITASAFAMWRAVFSFCFVDNVLSIEEQHLLHSYLIKVPFSETQRAILREDLMTPKDVVSLYKKITDIKDKKHFCLLARAIVWSEGRMDQQEEAILRRVSCLKDLPDSDYLKSTRDHPDLHHYHEHYHKAGVMGLFKAPPQLRLRA